MSSSINQLTNKQLVEYHRAGGTAPDLCSELADRLLDADSKLPISKIAIKDRKRFISTI